MVKADKSDVRDGVPYTYKKKVRNPLSFFPLIQGMGLFREEYLCALQNYYITLLRAKKQGTTKIQIFALGLFQQAFPLTFTVLLSLLFLPSPLLVHGACSGPQPSSSSSAANNYCK